ncbi:restriction endonuclease subunit S [Bacillus cereus]|nr:restriction endonuclease subunit S [Bacillus cereus]
MNVPKLRFKEFDEEWEKFKIGDHVKESRILGSKGDTAKKISVKRWGKGVVEKHTVHSGSDNTQYYIRKKGQFIYGKFDFLLGALGVVPEELDGYESTLDSPAFDLSKELDISFLDFYTQRKEFYLHYGSIANGSRQARRVHAEDFYSMPLIMPKLDEQIKIGNFLNVLNKKIQIQQQKIDLLQEQKKGFLQKMFPKAGETQPEIRFDGFAGDWEQRKLGEVANVFDGTHQTPKYTATGVKFVSVENIATLETNKFISQESYDKEYSKKQAEKGDVLMTRIGDIGTAKVIETEESLAYYVTLALFKPNKIDSDFLAWLISSPEVQRNIWKRTLHIAFPKKINLGEINKIEMMVPNNEEQTKIGAFFKQLDDTIALHQQKITALKEQKKGFMQQMFI